MKSVTCLLSLAFASRLKNWPLGRGACNYPYLTGTQSIWERWAPLLSLGGAGGVLGRVGIGCGVYFLHRSDWGAPVRMLLQRVCWRFAVPFLQGRQLSMLWSWTIAGCIPIAAFTFLRPRNSSPQLLSSSTSAWGFLIRYCISSIVARENPPLAILAIFQATRMSDCSSCTRPQCHAIVADMLKTYKKLVAASKNKTRQLPLRCLKPASSNLGDASHEIGLQKSRNWQHHAVRVRGLCGKMPSSTLEVSHYRHLEINHIALYIYPLYFIRPVSSCVTWHGLTDIQLHVSYSCCYLSYGPIVYVCHGSYFQWLLCQRCGGRTGVCIAAVSNRVLHWMKRCLVGSIPICSHLAEVLM